MDTLLSIDWDYFVPEKSEWDFGHQESLLFLDMLWMQRLGYREQMKTSGEEIDFWKRLPVENNAIVAYISDSHLYAAQTYGTIDRVILYDAHHDLWPLYKDGSFGCSNWLTKILEENPLTEVIWIQPEWAKGLFEVPEKYASRVDTEIPDQTSIDLLHICRSGCWTPPWLDNQFISFVDELAIEIETLQDGPWDPLKPRWDEEKLRQIEESHKTVQEMIRTMQTSVSGE